MRAARFFDGERWRDGALVEEDGRMLVRDEPPAPGMPWLDGVVVGAFTDHHVHLQLVDASRLAASRLGRVIDLGANPAELMSYRDPWPLSEERSAETTRAAGATIAVDFAGAFLTPPGGYPSDRSWAPAGSVREIATAADAASAVAEMADAGASCIKVASNSTAGPVFDDELFRAIVDVAARRGLPVVAHAEGPGEAQRAARLGAAGLAHAPFSERLTDDEIAEQAAAVSWISTLAIHEGDARATAIDNVRRFVAAGGRLRYGTDMGNGPTPVDLNPAELTALREAGLDGLDLLRTLTPADPCDPASVLLLLPRETSDPLDARPVKV